MQVQTPYNAPRRDERRLQAILQQIKSQVGLDAICACLFNREIKQLKVLSQVATGAPAPKIDHEMIVQWLSVVDDPIAHTTLNFPSNATIWANLIDNELFGLVIFWGYPPDADLSFWTDIIHTAIENYHLREQFVDADSIAQAIHMIAPDPSPQNVIRALRNYVFNEHVSGCVILTYDPIREGYSKGPFSHLKVNGSWSKSLGSNATVGELLEIDQDSLLLAQLERDKFVTYDDVEDLRQRQTNPIIRKLIDIDDVQSVTLIALETEQHKLGLIVVYTNIPYEFTPYEIKKYRIISEYLMMSTLTSVLQKQHDFVQQGRAALLDAVTDAVVMLMMDEDATVLTVNKQFIHMFDLHESEALGIPLCNLLDKMHLPTDLRQSLREKWKNGGQMPSHGEFNMVGMQGVQSDIEWYSRLVYRQGELIGRIYTLHDVTPERTTYRLRHKLLSRISHELRTPLTSIRGFARFILDEEAENLPDLAREYIEIIHQSAIGLNALIDDAIEITRADIGELSLDMEKTSLSELVQDVVELVNVPQAIVVNYNEDISQVNVDVERIERVLMNLLDNASKYSPIDTTIEINIKHVETGIDFAPIDLVTPCIVVSVYDQGDGIDQRDAEKVFLPFYRTETPQREQIVGVGLGLAISRSIVEMHRGKIWVQPSSSKSPGGRFFFSIPTS